jgi:hypothetical protein
MSRATPWIKLIDERILEHLDENGDCFPFEISLDLAMTASTDRVREHCWVLANAGFVDPTQHKLAHDRHGTKFGLSDRGRDYLDDELNAELIRPLPGMRPPYATRPGWWAGFS